MRTNSSSALILRCSAWMICWWATDLALFGNIGDDAQAGLNLSWMLSATSAISSMTFCL